MRATADIDYSMVVCTYNPDPRILQRCLNAIRRLDTTGLSTEVILVDNNSDAPLESLPAVQETMRALPGMQLLLVREQGVNHARMAAIRQSKGRYIVYFDYDNEPESDYLQELKKLNAQYPEVAAWGPGIVHVDFIDGIDTTIARFASLAFQQRQEREIRFSREPDWQSCYPFGTGLCTQAALLKEYVQLAAGGALTLTGRKGNQLSSGEDTQMVLLCVSKGYAAGVAPSLQLTHIIPGQRANSRYLQRLLYGTFVCYDTCWLQVFPAGRSRLEQRMMPGGRFARKALKKYLKARWSADPHKTFELVQFIAIQAGVYKALDRPLPPMVSRIVKSLNVE